MSNEEAGHYPKNPPTPPTARGSTSEDITIGQERSKLQEPERGKQTKEERKEKDHRRLRSTEPIPAPVPSKS